MPVCAGALGTIVNLNRYLTGEPLVINEVSALSRVGVRIALAADCLPALRNSAKDLISS